MTDKDTYSEKKVVVPERIQNAKSLLQDSRYTLDPEGNLVPNDFWQGTLEDGEMEIEWFAYSNFKPISFLNQEMFVLAVFAIMERDQFFAMSSEEEKEDYIQLFKRHLLKGKKSTLYVNRLKRFNPVKQVKDRDLVRWTVPELLQLFSSPNYFCRMTSPFSKQLLRGKIGRYFVKYTEHDTENGNPSVFAITFMSNCTEEVEILYLENRGKNILFVDRVFSFESLMRELDEGSVTIRGMRFKSIQKIFGRDVTNQVELCNEKEGKIVESTIDGIPCKIFIGPIGPGCVQISSEGCLSPIGIDSPDYERLLVAYNSYRVFTFHDYLKGITTLRRISDLIRLGEALLEHHKIDSFPSNFYLNNMVIYQGLLYHIPHDETFSEYYEDKTEEVLEAVSDIMNTKVFPKVFAKRRNATQYAIMIVEILHGRHFKLNDTDLPLEIVLNNINDLHPDRHLHNPEMLLYCQEIEPIISLVKTSCLNHGRVPIIDFVTCLHSIANVLKA